MAAFVQHSADTEFQPRLSMAATEIGRNFRIRSCSGCTYCSTQRLTSTATIVQANNENNPRRHCRRSARRSRSRQWCTMALSRLLFSSHAHRSVVRPSHRCRPGYPQCIAILRTTTRAVRRRRVERSARLRATAAAQVLKENGASPCAARRPRIHVCSAARFMAQSEAHQLPCPRFGACAARTMPCRSGR
jgi:hypothetical protein